MEIRELLPYVIVVAAFMLGWRCGWLRGTEWVCEEKEQQTQAIMRELLRQGHRKEEE